jgi:hypothetical protein
MYENSITAKFDVIFNACVVFGMHLNVKNDNRSQIVKFDNEHHQGYT